MTALRSEWGGIRRWQERVTWAGRKLRAAPAPVRILAIAVIAFLGFFAINLFYHVLRKPTEIFAFVSANFNKAPAETWRQYGRLFREYSTAAISPELLAALAQVEGAGNPVARTYWRWQLSWNPLALYQPASSGVGMFQMTDAAFAEARQFCIRNHIVSQDACRLGWLYIRVLPSHAIELAAVYLDRNLERIFAGPATAKQSAEHKGELASMIHLCGAAAAKAFAQRGFRLVTGERCGSTTSRTTSPESKRWNGGSCVSPQVNKAPRIWALSVTSAAAHQNRGRRLLLIRGSSSGATVRPAAMSWTWLGWRKIDIGPNRSAL